MSATCRDCGRSWDPPASLTEGYDGWTPPQCPDCFDGGTSRPRGSGGGRAAGGGGRHDTLEQVLDRHHGGPSSGVFTDGSAIPNPGPGGWGAVYVHDDEVVQRVHGHETETTNNRMELRAIIEGIGLVPQGTEAVLHTDSRLAVDTLTSWAAGWKKRGWKRRTGPVENLDLVRAAFELVSARPEIELRWIKAHAGSRWNEYADALATAWARSEL